MPFFPFPLGGEGGSSTGWPTLPPRYARPGDIALIPTGFAGEPAVIANDLAQDDGLETAVQLSLFLDARAGAGDVLPSPDPYRRGWWADQFEVDRVSIGSRLWLLERSKRTPAVLAAAREYALEALRWLIEDGVASAVEVATSWFQDNGLAFEITISRPGDTAASRFGYVWQGV